MKKELKEIALKLRDWCKKYNKDYCDITFINNNIMTSIDTSDKDYLKLEMYINDDK